MFIHIYSEEVFFLKKTPNLEQNLEELRYSVNPGLPQPQQNNKI